MIMEIAQFFCVNSAIDMCSDRRLSGVSLLIENTSNFQVFLGCPDENGLMFGPRFASLRYLMLFRDWNNPKQDLDLPRGKNWV